TNLMKTTSLALVMAITLCAASVTLASNKPKEAKDANKPMAEKVKKPSKSETDTEKVLLTGSYLKQNVRRNGRITDGPSQIIVLDRATIERSGASDLRQLLAHQGI